MKFQVCAVVVSFNPTADLYQNVELLRRQNCCVLVVDNSPGSNGAGVLADIQLLDGCEVIRNGRNLGIAAALNIGIRAAMSRGCSWVLLFDQDSQISEGFVEAMLRAARTSEPKGSVAIVCPRYRDARLGVTLPTQRNRAGEIVGCMTSGSLINVRAFQTLGPMEERLFIDFVDHEYCLRTRTAGWKIVEAPDAVLLHSLGRMSSHRFLGRRMTTTNHSPERRYYIHRNRMTLIWRYRRKDTEWAFGELKGWVMDSAKVLLIEDQKLAKAKYMALGFYDALRGRLGPRVEL
jgi:rhamnosyltransferase